MSSKNVEIPYNLLAQGIQTVSYPANSLYAQTMNAPTAVTLDMYLNNHLTDNRVIQPNYELNLENIDIDEVKVSMGNSLDLNNITLSNTLSLPTGYNIIYNPNNNLIYTVTSYTSPLTIKAINSFGDVVYSYSSAAYYIQQNYFNQIVIDNLNNIYFILISSSNSNYYIVKFDSTLNLIKSVLVPTPYSYKCILTIYNNNIYYIYALEGGDALNIGQYSLNLTLINSSQMINANFQTLLISLTAYSYSMYNDTLYYFIASNNVGYIYSINLNNIYNSKVIIFNLPVNNNNVKGDSIIIYNPTLDITYLIYSSVSGTTIITASGNDINNFSFSNYINLPTVQLYFNTIGLCDSNNNIWIVSYEGYIYMLQPSENTFIIAKTFTTFSAQFPFYILATSTNIIAIISTDAYIFNNNIVSQPLNNSNYQNSFNMILGCGCP